MTFHSTDRTASALDGIVSDLIALVSDLIALALFAEQAIWNLEQWSFGPERVVFEGVADLAREAADSVAERAATLSHHPDRRPETVAKQHTLAELGPGAGTETPSLRSRASSRQSAPIPTSSIDRRPLRECPRTASDTTN